MRQFGPGGATAGEKPLDDRMVVDAKPVVGSRAMSRPQRVLEIVLAAVGLVVTAPVMLLIACIIGLDSRGPVLFFQHRVGKDRKPFRFVKFRTMYVDARQRFPGLYKYQYSSEVLADLKFKVDGDPRVTRAGIWLRRSSLDELPESVERTHRRHGAGRSAARDSRDAAVLRGGHVAQIQCCARCHRTGPGFRARSAHLLRYGQF